MKLHRNSKTKIVITKKLLTTVIYQFPMSRGRGKPMDVPRHTIRSPFYVLLLNTNIQTITINRSCFEDHIKS